MGQNRGSVRGRAFPPERTFLRRQRRRTDACSNIRQRSLRNNIDGTFRPFSHSRIFGTFFAIRTVRIGDRDVPLGSWWLKHRDRRQYEGITFQPG